MSDANQQHRQAPTADTDCECGMEGHQWRHWGTDCESGVRLLSLLYICLAPRHCTNSHNKGHHGEISKITISCKSTSSSYFTTSCQVFCPSPQSCEIPMPTPSPASHRSSQASLPEVNLARPAQTVRLGALLSSHPLYLSTEGDNFSHRIHVGGFLRPIFPVKGPPLFMHWPPLLGFSIIRPGADAWWVAYLFLTTGGGSLST